MNAMHSVLSRTLVACACTLALAGCADDGKNNPSSSTTAASSGPGQPGGTATEPADRGYIVGGVAITDSGRTTYVRHAQKLEGHLKLDQGIETAGNAVYLVQGSFVFIGESESPTWVKYELMPDGSFQERGRLSLASYGLTSIDFGKAMVDATTAVTVSSDALLAIVWNPTTMSVTGTIDLSHMKQEGFDLENWSMSVNNGKVYVPGRWVNWDKAQVLPKVMTTVIDPKALKVLAIAEDDRCASGGEIVFDAAGNGYVMGDGRNYSWQMFAHATSAPVPRNCILKLPVGGTDFDPNYVKYVTDLTGGLESISEMQGVEVNNGVAFAKLFYPDRLPPDVKPVDFEFWKKNAHKLWRFNLGDNPSAQEINGAQFSSIGFSGKASEGAYLIGESLDEGATSKVFRVDVASNTMAQAFTMDGYFYGATKVK